MQRHPLYPALQLITTVLADNGIRYALAGGTQLGAVRDGALIAHDYDFDLDVFVEDVPRLRSIASDLAPHGLALEEKWSAGVRLADGQRMTGPHSFASCIRVLWDGSRVGDLYVFTVFNDGIARRYDHATTTYYNPRTQNPAWYYEQLDIAELYGDPYPVMRDAKVVIENTYGPRWRTPIEPGSHGPGHHKNGGAVVGRIIEPAINHALNNGWDTDYGNCPPWPPPITHVNSMRARPWVIRNEPLVAITGGNQKLHPSPADVGLAQAMTLRNVAVRALHKAFDDAGVLTAERTDAELLATRRRLAATRQRLEAQHDKLRQLRRNPVAFGWRYGLSKLRQRS